jgi:thymidylate synthase (FAD)
MKDDNEPLVRPAVADLDNILGKQLPVLDDGFVRVVDYLGSDHAIVQAARVSYGKGTRTVSDDRTLIRYLRRHAHTTPFEMCEIKLHVRVPMDTWRQWIRHRTANVNEYSTRYSVAIDAAQKTDPEAWRAQSTTNRQGSGDFIDSSTGRRLSEEETQLHKMSREVYERRLGAGIAREQARKDLPLSTYTEAYWKVDLHNLLHFLRLRLHPDAQAEIRAYAQVVGFEVVEKWCPLAWEAFLDYELNGLHLSAEEAKVIQLLHTSDLQTVISAAVESRMLERTATGIKAGREWREALAKFRRLGIDVPDDLR